MASYIHAQQPWDDALAVLAAWVPRFSEVTRPEQLSFDCVAGIMSAVPDGFQTIFTAPPDSDSAFIDVVLDQCRQRPCEVIVVPDLGMVSRLPLRLPVSELTRFVTEFDYVSGSRSLSLLDGASDTFFGFDTGDMLLVDHDERIWFSPSPFPAHP